MKRILVSACLLGLPCRYDGRSRPHAVMQTLLDTEGIEWIPFCPEQAGGLPTPRPASEVCGMRVINCEGLDVTDAYRRGAEGALTLCRLFSVDLAVLKERSPSCGSGEIYDGSFRRKLIEGDGITTRLLRENGIPVMGESQISLDFLKQFVYKR